MTGHGGRSGRAQDGPRPAIITRPGLRSVAAFSALAALAVLVPAGPAAAIGPGGPSPFSLRPAPSGSSRPLPYFKLSLQPGQSARLTALITNLGRKSERIKLSDSTGVTAANGGISFSGAYKPCSGPGCWVTGLPRQVTLPTGTQQRLPVTVRIPRSTRRGQYLAGITAELAKKPRPVVVGSSKKASAQAIIVQQVTVGIAVTVGPASALTSRLAISGVTGGLEGVTPRLSIHVANTGRTFLHGQGMVSWHVASAPLSAPVFVGTVLPGDDALIAVNAPRMPTGATTLVQVRIRYGPGLTARWSGMVTIPARPHLRLIHTGKGAYSVVPAGRTPVWAIAIIVVGILLLVVLALLTWLLVRSRRRHVPAHSKDRDIADRLDSYTRK